MRDRTVGREAERARQRAGTSCGLRVVWMIPKIGRSWAKIDKGGGARPGWAVVTCVAAPQAFVYRHFNQRNGGVFSPAAVRQLAPGERAEGGPVGYVPLDGLGKLAYSNIRRPRPLMDIDTGTVSAGGSGEGERERRATPAQYLMVRAGGLGAVRTSG